MAAITRNLEQISQDSYDLIIIGGGIYGSMSLLEASRAGLKAILLEKSDFGWQTSFNSLRIVHGGLRYLQTMHLARLHESVTERSWFLRNFPDLVRPLPCLMPLYRDLTKNRMTLRVAMRMNDWLTRDRNEGISPELQIPDGEIISAAETRRRFPLVRADGLRGAALWYDAAMLDSNRLLMEVLRWSASAGGSSVNYAEVTNLLRSGGQIKGVIARDALTGRDHQIEAPLIVNATGPECRAVAQQFSVDNPTLFKPSLAWNILFDRLPLSEGAVAIQAPTGKSRNYFAHSLGGRLFVGTGHAPVDDNSKLGPAEEDVNAMLADLNRAIPGIDLHASDIGQIFWGQLPARRVGTVKLASKPVILDHGREGGPEGLFTVSGVKFTTARSTASKLVSKLKGRIQVSSDAGLRNRPPPAAYDLHPMNCVGRADRIRRARELIEHEVPQSLVDLLIRRSNLVGDPEAALGIAEDCCNAFGWGSERSNVQIKELSAFFAQRAAPH